MRVNMCMWLSAGTVSYNSLAWAHAWHLGDDVNETHVPQRLAEYYEHLLGRWVER